MYYSVDHQYDTCHHLKMVLKMKTNFKMKKQENKLVEKHLANVTLKGLISHNLTCKDT